MTKITIIQIIQIISLRELQLIRYLIYRYLFVRIVGIVVPRDPRDAPRDARDDMFANVSRETRSHNSWPRDARDVSNNSNYPMTRITNKQLFDLSLFIVNCRSARCANYRFYCII